MCHPKHIHSDRVSELSWAGYCILCTAVLKHAVRPISVCFSGWNTDARSRRKFPYQRLHWYNSGCFPSNFSKWWALNSAAVLFFFLSSLQDAWEPGRDPMPLLHTSYVLLRYEKAPFIGGVEERSIQFPNLIFALREMFLFLMSLAHAHIQTHPHKWSLPCCPSIPQGYGHAFSLHINFFVCTSWPSVIHDHKKREWAVRVNKMNISGTDMQDWAVQWLYRSLKYLLALLKANKNAFWTFEFAPYRQWLTFILTYLHYKISRFWEVEVDSCTCHKNFWLQHP